MMKISLREASCNHHHYYYMRKYNHGSQNTHYTISPSAQFFPYSNFRFMQFQFVKDALGFKTTVLGKQYFI